MISRSRADGPAPSVAAASDTRGSRFAQYVPTIRTTTATLKNACAIEDRNPPAFDAVREDREERERHDDRREHERDDDQRADEAASTESVATEDVGRGNATSDRQRGRRERLPDGEPHDLARQRIR